MAEGSVLLPNFFISRAGVSAKFAIWLGRLIAAQGKTYLLQDEHFGHQNFLAAMDRGLKSGARVVGMLTQAYLESDHCLAEAGAALYGDPLNRKERLILLRLEPCAPGGVLSNIAFTDLLAELRQPDAAPLQLKILRALGFDNPKLAGLPPPPDGILPERVQIVHPEIRPVPEFAGREGELAAIEAALWSKGGTAALTNTGLPANVSAALATLKGLGGVGKSVLAREYAWRNRERYHGVWWIRAEKPETLLDDLIELGSRLVSGLKEVQDRSQAARAALDAVARLKAEKPWLLVYDNVNEPGEIDKLTPVAGAHVLITTRWSDWGRAVVPVKVTPFPPGVAAQFLLDTTGRIDRAGAEKLAEALGYLPLALDHAAAYMRRTGIDFPTYEKLAANLIEKAPKGVAYETPVFATFALAIDKAAEACPEAEKLMGLCAFLAPDRIPLDLFTTDVMSEIERGEAVAALVEVSLVTLEPMDDGSPGLSVHRLVQEVMRGRLRSGGRYDDAAAAVRDLVLAPLPKGNDVYQPASWSTYRRLEPHAASLLEHLPDSVPEPSRTSLLLSLVAEYYRVRAHYALAEPLMRRALAIEEASPDSAHPNLAVYLNNLAELLKYTDRPGEAEQLMRRALAIDEASLGSDHPNVGIRLNNLAELMRVTNRLDEAEPLCRRALEIGEKNFGPEHPRFAIHLNNLALLLQATNRLGEAEFFYRRALAIDEANSGPEDLAVAIDLNNLGELLRVTNRPGEAEPLMRRALAIVEACLGTDHPTTRTTRANLAVLEEDLRARGTRAPAAPDGAVRAAANREPAPKPAKRSLWARVFGGG
jgi:tetratricopeptide (TPR) repeat protein